MEIVTLNSHLDVRREIRNGVEYLIAPITFIVQGVLPGNKGPLYYPSQEIVKNHYQWEGIPLTLRHPFLNGKWVSAKNQKVLSSQGIGALFNPKIFVENNLTKLRGLGHFVVKALKKLHPQTLKKIENGEKIEVSTGLFTNNHRVRPQYFNGEYYDQVARDYRPDHIAILPDEVGACSIQDGCGVLNMKSLTTNCHCGGKCEPCKKKLKEKKMTKQELIENLAVNCKIEASSLQNISEAQLQTLVENHNIAEAAKLGFKDDGKLYWFDMERKKFVRNKDEEMTDEDEEEEDDEEEEVENSEEEDEEEEETENKGKGKKPTKNCDKSDEEEPTDNSSRTAYWIEKAQIVANTTSHLKGDVKERMIKRLSKKSLSELRDIETLSSPRKKAVFAANSGGPTINSSSDDTLDLPTVDFNN